MKRAFLSFMLCAAAALAFSACDNPDIDDQGSDTPPAGSDASNLYIYGSATDTGFDLETMESFEELQGLYTWEGYLKSGASFQFPTQNTSEWPSYMIDEDEEGNLVLVYGESEEDLVVYTVDIDGTYEIIIDMRDEENVELSIELVAPDMSKMDITELYILGDATATGWNLATMNAFEQEPDGVFTWEGPLKAELRFRFPLQKIPEPATWWPCLMAGEDGQIIFGNRDADEVNTPVESDGVYRIVVDVRDKENMTYTITLIESGLPETQITSLYMYGPATSGGWDVTKGQPFTNDDGIFTWTGNLTADNEFRMNISNEANMFFPAIVLEKGTTNAVYCEIWDPEVYDQFKVAEDGSYKVVVNAKKYDEITYTINKVGSIEEEVLTITELYMLGPATAAGYDLTKMEPFTANESIFTWEGQLSADVFRFQTQKNDFVPALFKGAEDGKLVYIKTYDEANTATPLSVSEAGHYRIVVDATNVENMTYTITLMEAKFEVSKLYILGGATDNGWNLAYMPKFTEKDGIFTWEGNLKSNDAFRFPLQKKSNAWFPCLVPSADGKSVTLQQEDNGNTYRVASDGKYRVTINIYDASLNIERIGDYETNPKLVIYELYVLGEATKNGWSLETMPEFANNNGIFTWTGTLYANKEFRFPTQSCGDAWWPCLVIEADGSKIFYGTSDNDKRLYYVAEDGTYTITVDARDTDNLSYTIEKQ